MLFSKQVFLERFNVRLIVVLQLAFDEWAGGGEGVLVYPEAGDAAEIDQAHVEVAEAQVAADYFFCIFLFSAFGTADIAKLAIGGLVFKLVFC